jgi:hypothetical protein
MLTNMLVCYFNEDYKLLYGSLEGAIAAAVSDAPLMTKKVILKEWREWQSAEGQNAEDLRRFVNDGFHVAILFKKPIDARNFMNRIYDELMAAVRKETSYNSDVPL